MPMIENYEVTVEIKVTVHNRDQEQLVEFTVGAVGTGDSVTGVDTVINDTAANSLGQVPSLAAGVAVNETERLA